ncbi:MAG: hypothetical protein IJG87_06055 [Ruminococcus sp.]|nr:hypothetical protein [Ruminococcus sp.]
MSYESVYERANLLITEFDTDDVIATSTPASTEPPVVLKAERENAYGGFSTFGNPPPRSWF